MKVIIIDTDPSSDVSTTRSHYKKCSVVNMSINGVPLLKFRQAMIESRNWVENSTAIVWEDWAKHRQILYQIANKLELPRHLTRTNASQIHGVVANILDVTSPVTRRLATWTWPMTCHARRSHVGSSPHFIRHCMNIFSPRVTVRKWNQNHQRLRVSQ